MTGALFFDLDGTLADTHALRIATWIEVLGPHGVEVDMDLYRERLLGKPNYGAIKDLLPHLDEGEVEELLEAGRGQGMHLLLVTNAPRDAAESSLEALGFADRFDAMILAEDVGAEKPDPAPYREALDRLGVPPGNCLTFEDSPKGVRAAAEAGIPVVGLVSTHRPGELREAGAELVVGDFADPAVYARLNGGG